MQSRLPPRLELPMPISHSGPEIRPTDLRRSSRKSRCCDSSRRAAALNSSENLRQSEKRKRTNSTAAIREAFLPTGSNWPFLSGTESPVDVLAAPGVREQQQPPNRIALPSRREPLRKNPDQQTNRNS